MVLHVISFDIPFPPDYGGVIDVYYRVKALADAGVRVILHCFAYGRPASRELSEICAEVHYYERKKPLASLPIKIPHITYSRRSKALLKRLQADKHPIWFEGLHCCYYLDHKSLKDRKKFVRMHNIEWQYYELLAKTETDLVRKRYMLQEAKVLKKYEIVLWDADRIFAISRKDKAYLEEKYVGVEYLPAFHASSDVNILLGKGKYCLYHGNLAVGENHEAAMFLIEKVFAKLPHQLIIAGSNPQPALIEAISKYDHILLRHNPGEAEMTDLMRQAHVHVLPTFQDTGIKLKLLHSLYTGRFVLVNTPMVAGTELEDACLVADDPGDMQALLKQLFRFEMTEEECKRRADVLGRIFDNQANAKRIVKVIWE
jgi:hypothetical protein